MKVSIVGAGIAGLSLAWALTKRGVAVTVFDQGPIPNPISSSFDEHRITRHTYAGLDGYGSLMPRTFELYDALWRDLGSSHYLPTGMVYVSRVAEDLYGHAASELDGLGIAHRPVSTDELATRLPFLNLEGVLSAFEAEGAGLLFAQRIVTDLATWLAANGAELRPNTKVTHVDFTHGTLLANGQHHSADQVIVAAGAWVSDLVPDIAGRAVPSRQLVLYLEPPAHHAEAWATAPILVDVAPGHGSYILPPRNGTRLKIGDHVFTRKGHGADDRVATEADIAPVLASYQRAFRDADDYAILDRKVCYYTVTEDERFIVARTGPSGWVVSACSGHGFKLGVLVGDTLARAILGEITADQAQTYLAGLGSQ